MINGDVGHFLPTQAASPPGQEYGVGPRQVPLAVAPGNLLDGDSTPWAVHPTHRIRQHNSDRPQSSLASSLASGLVSCSKPIYRNFGRCFIALASLPPLAAWPVQSSRRAKRSQALRGRNLTRDNPADGASKPPAPLPNRSGAFSVPLGTPESMPQKIPASGPEPQLLPTTHRLC